MKSCFYTRKLQEKKKSNLQIVYIMLIPCIKIPLQIKNKLFYFHNEFFYGSFQS